MWLRESAPSAAGRMGLFRVVYSLFYLWHLAYVEADLLAVAPSQNWRPILLYKWVLGRPPEWLPGFAESLLAALLILLLVGVRVRVVTVMVFLVGSLLDGFVQSLGKVEHATIFLTFYLPLIMSFSTWGDTYSIEALKRHSFQERQLNRSDSHWRHIWPMRLVLLLLSFLFLTAGLSKWLMGNWLTDVSIFSDLVIRAYYRSIVQGLVPNPFIGIVLETPLLNGFLRLFVPIFESFFFLVLFGPQIRRAYLAAIILFHSLNAMLLAVTFTPVLIAYGIAFDWEWLLDSGRRLLGISRKAAGPAWSARTLEAVAMTIAVLMALDWNTAGFGRLLFSLGGALNWLTIFYLAAPVAFVVLVISLIQLGSSRRRA